MNIFFGKISDKFDKNQITEGYYQAPKNGSWFNGITIGDYAYIIGGGKIQLWKAKEWQQTSNNEDRLYFNIINTDIRINIERFVAFKFFFLDVPLVVKTTRSTAVEQKAFFPIKYADFDIYNFSLFLESENFRKIINVVSDSLLIEDSHDFQFYFADDEIYLGQVLFCDPNLQAQFNGKNLQLHGKGSKNKDRVLQNILSYKNIAHIFDDIKIHQVYDTFMCIYKVKDNNNQKKYWLVNGNELDKIHYDIENNLFVMQQQYNEQHNPAVSALLNKCKEIKEGDGVLLYNKNKYYAYGEFKSIDFESSRMEELQSLRNQKGIIENDLSIFSDAECYFEDTRSTNGYDGLYGQRLLVNQWYGVHESGIQIYGVGYETTMVNTTIIKLPNHKFYNKVVRILDGDKFYMTENELQEAKSLIEFKKQIILQGPPGTGKTYTAKNLAEYIVRDEVSSDKVEQARFINVSERIELIQFHPSYTYEDFIRGIVTEPIGDKILYLNKDKLFLEIVDKANKDLEKLPYILIIDEINRANLSAVFGELIYALEYRNESFRCLYPDNMGNYKISIPKNLYIIGTMNTSDRSVGHIDYALRRRFAFLNVLPKVFNSDNFDRVLFNLVSSLFVKEVKNNVSELESSPHLSLEFKDRPQDIWLGHSYFFKEVKSNFKLRIEFEILPILQEYIKDGILINTFEVQTIIGQIIEYKVPDVNIKD